MQARQGAGVITGIGDDCAVLQVPAGQQLVVSIDTLVEGIHFLPATPPAEVANRLLGAAVSDLAAAAATPAWLTLALTLSLPCAGIYASTVGLRARPRCVPFASSAPLR